MYKMPNMFFELLYRRIRKKFKLTYFAWREMKYVFYSMSTTFEANGKL